MSALWDQPEDGLQMDPTALDRGFGGLAERPVSSAQDEPEADKA
jgi:hypothetical protein